MDYYFVRNITTNLGPLNAAVAVAPGGTIKQAVESEVAERGLSVHDHSTWKAEPISAAEAADLMREAGPVIERV